MTDFTLCINNMSHVNV